MGKVCVRFTPAENECLEEIYQKGSKIYSYEVQSIAESLGCTELRIRSWLSRRRRKDGNILSVQHHFTKEQVEQLEIEYQNSSMPEVHALSNIAETLGVEDMTRVKNWFARRRKAEHGGSNTPILSEEQSEYLLSIYAKTKYPRTRKLTRIAEACGLTTHQITAWFFGKRATDKADGSIPFNRKRRRNVEIGDLSTTTTEFLEAAFAENSVPTTEKLKEIQNITNIDERRLEAWFDHKRRITANLKSMKRHHKALKEAYQINKYLTAKELRELADRIGIEHKRVRNWFRYRRERDTEFDRNKLVFQKHIKFDADQRSALNEAYQRNRKLPPKEIYALADRLGLKKIPVQRWFCAKRCADKVQKKTSMWFTAEQTKILQAAYQLNSRPSRKEKEKVAVDVGLSYKQVTTWYFRTGGMLNRPRISPPLTNKQRSVLIAAYAQESYPPSTKLAELANCIGVTESRVRNWFGYYRKLSAANNPQGNQEESDVQDIDVNIKKEPMDVKCNML